MPQVTLNKKYPKLCAIFSTQLAIGSKYRVKADRKILRMSSPRVPAGLF